PAVSCSLCTVAPPARSLPRRDFTRIASRESRESGSKCTWLPFRFTNGRSNLTEHCRKPASTGESAVRLRTDLNRPGVGGGTFFLPLLGHARTGRGSEPRGAKTDVGISTNREWLVRVAVVGQIAPQEFEFGYTTPYSISHDGTPRIVPG